MENGTRLGSYTIDRPLASGGMGSVYLATGPDGERVAIKTVDTNSAAHLVSLRREIRALLAVDHPSIVRVVGHGLYEALPWFAMEFIEGSPLRDYFQSGYATRVMDEVVDTYVNTPSLSASTNEYVRDWNQRVPAPDEQRTLLGQLAKVFRGLGHLHAAGLVHRDLKPENIVIRFKDQEPVIVDFGIATPSAGSQRERLSRIANLAGTPSYMSPEQAQGWWSDARSDLYSMGCMMYEVLTGHPPFEAGSVVGLLTSHIHSPVPPLPPTVDPGIAQLVYRLLAKAREDRPGYGHDVARELEAILGLPPSNDVAPIYLYRPGLIGRDAQMRVCQDALGQLAAGTGGVTVISGASGSGKTRFVLELSALIDAHPNVEYVMVAHNPGIEAEEGRNPFTAVLAEYADRCREAGPEFTQRMLGDSGAVLAKVYPPLLDLPGMEGVVPPVDLPAESEAMRRVQAWVDLMYRTHPNRPVAVILDEFESRYVDYLRIFRSVTNTRPTPLWLFVTMSSGNQDVLADFARHQIVELTPLDQFETEQLAKSALGLSSLPAALADVLFVQSAGNPARISELLRRAVDLGYLSRDADGQWLVSDAASLADLPADTDTGRLMLARIGAFGESSQVLLHHLALAQSGIPLSLAEQLLDDADLLDQALDPLLACGAVVVRSHQVAFTENQLKIAVSQSLGSATRREVHSRLARLLAEDPRADAVEIGRHHRAADEMEQARACFLRAADGSNTRGQISKRWDELRLYLETDPPQTEATLTAYCEFLAMSQRLARTEELRVVSEEALVVADAMNRPDVRARVMAIQAHRISATDLDRACEILDEALSLAGIGEARARILNAYGNVLIRAGEGVRAVPYLAESLELLKDIDDPFLVASTTLNHAVALVSSYRYDEAIEGLNRALDLTQAHQFELLEAYVLGNLSIIVREHSEDLNESLRLIRAAQAKHRRCFDASGDAAASLYVASTLVLMRDFEAAVPEAQEALKRNVFAETGDAALVKARTILGGALAGAGRFAEARTVFNEVNDDVRSQVDRLYHGVEASSMERRLGRLEEAQRWLDWASSGWDRFTAEERSYLLAAKAHLNLARGEALDWPPEGGVPSQDRHVRAIERAIASDAPLWFGETEGDVFDAIPPLADVDIDAL